MIEIKKFDETPVGLQFEHQNVDADYRSHPTHASVAFDKFKKVNTLLYAAPSSCADGRW